MNNIQKILALLSVISLLIALSGCEITANPREPQATTSTTTSTTTATTATTTTTTPITENSTATSLVTSTVAEKSTLTSSTKAKEYAYAYAGFNPQLADMSVPFNEILLNRYYCLPDGYKPKLAPAIDGSKIMLDYRVAPYYKMMYEAALADSITLTPISGYRSFARQKENFEWEIANNQKKGMDIVKATQKAAEVRLLPGTSEHNAGLAMDICSLSTKFETTKEFQWLQEHAHEYGFILRYPKDKTDITKITYEPWHYRYVGLELAQQLKQSGQVLEEVL